MFSRIALFPAVIGAAYMWGAHAKEAKDDFEDLRIIRIMGRGCPKKSSVGDTVTVHYDGWLKENYPEGKKFDSSNARNKPFTFKLGDGKVIKGWEEGLKDMCVGEKRLLEVPPRHAYGKKGAGKVIGPDATLVFEINMLEVNAASKVAVGAGGAETAASEM